MSLSRPFVPLLPDLLGPQLGPFLFPSLPPKPSLSTQSLYLLLGAPLSSPRLGPRLTISQKHDDILGHVGIEFLKSQSIF
jgi:hypothetical protein